MQLVWRISHRCEAKNGGHLLQGFGCKIIAHDLYESEELKQIGVQYVTKKDLLQQADIVSLHCPLCEGTHHIIDEAW
jgi:D-lactate dehydrogenase